MNGSQLPELVFEQQDEVRNVVNQGNYNLLEQSAAVSESIGDYRVSDE